MNLFCQYYVFSCLFANCGDIDSDLTHFSHQNDVFIQKGEKVTFVLADYITREICI